MTEQIKPQIRVIKKEIEGIRFSLGSILLVLCCTFLIILSTFVQVNINHFIIPAGLFSGEHLGILDFVHTYKLIPQIPIVMFVGAFLGRKYGVLSVLLYVLLGLFIIPVFALGGGLKYIFEYGFGYILAYIPAVFLSGCFLKGGFTNKNVIKAVVSGVFTIHIIGILYMCFIAGLKHETFSFISGWIYAQSGIKILYDFVFSLIAVLAAKYAKIILWFYM